MSLLLKLQGKRHLGAAIGTHQFKNEYIDDKVSTWISNIKALSEIAKTQPHAAYAAFIHGEQHKYTYFLRTIVGIADNDHWTRQSTTSSYQLSLVPISAKKNENWWFFRYVMEVSGLKN